MYNDVIPAKAGIQFLLLPLFAEKQDQNGFPLSGMTAKEALRKVQV